MTGRGSIHGQGDVTSALKENLAQCGRRLSGAPVIHAIMQNRNPFVAASVSAHEASEFVGQTGDNLFLQPAERFMRSIPRPTVLNLLRMVDAGIVRPIAKMLYSAVGQTTSSTVVPIAAGLVRAGLNVVETTGKIVRPRTRRAS